MSAFIRVAVARHDEPVSAVVPSGQPLAEVVPDLLRAVGLLEAGPVHVGCRVERLDGRLLRTDIPLGRQGVADGDLLVVTPTSGEESLARYDHVLERTSRRSWFRRWPVDRPWV